MRRTVAKRAFRTLFASAAGVLGFVGVGGGEARAEDPPRFARARNETASAPALQPEASPAATPEPTQGESMGDAATKPPPLNVDYTQVGVAFASEVMLEPGAACPADAQTPCILGSGLGLVLRAGYRTPGPWYLGGAYEFVRMESGNLYRLGIFQQLRAEVRYLPINAYRLAPYVAFGVGGVAYGNEWGVETGGASVHGGGGLEIEMSRTAMLGLCTVYRPMLIAGWTDTAGQARQVGVAHYFGLDIVVEVRTEIERE